MFSAPTVRWIAAAAVAVASAILPASAQGQPGQNRARARLIAETSALVPGTTTTIGVTFTIDPGWHIYWDGFNVTGLPPEIRLTLPEGYEIGPWQWPAPHRYIAPGDLLDHVYERRVTLLTSLKTPAEAIPGSQVTLEADVEWMICSTVCLFEDGRATLTLPLWGRAADAQRPGPDAALVAETRARLPRPLPKKPTDVRLTWREGLLRIDAIGSRELSFYPGLKCAPPMDLVKNGTSKTGSIELRFEPEPGLDRVVGVLEIKHGPDARSALYTVDLPVP